MTDQNRARVLGNAAVDVCLESELAARYHPAIAAEFVNVPPEVEAGWIKTGSTWGPPPPRGDLPPPPIPTTLTIDVPTFLMRFTAPERVAIRASEDPLVVDFLRLLDDPRTVRVNVGLAPVQQALGYLAGLSQPNPLTPALIEPSRLAEILAPQPVST